MLSPSGSNPVPSLGWIYIELRVLSCERSRFGATGFAKRHEVLKEDGHWVTVGRRGRGAELHLCQADELEPKLNHEPSVQGINLVLHTHASDT
jgi:hypothetical protein